MTPEQPIFAETRVLEQPQTSWLITRHYLSTLMQKPLSLQSNTTHEITNKSQASEDGCINIRNMLSSKEWNNKTSDIKLASLYSTIKMMHGPINTRRPLLRTGSKNRNKEETSHKRVPWCILFSPVQWYLG